MPNFLNRPGPKRYPLQVRPLSLDSFERELHHFLFLSDKEKTEPLTQQTWSEIWKSKLRRYPTCRKILIKKLLNDHGMEGYVFKVDIDGTGPYALKVVCDALRMPIG
jgi:hypothetical protein